MNQTQQMIAIIRTMLYFMGKQMYMPTASDVLPILQEALASQPLAPQDGKSAPIVWTPATSSTPSANATGRIMTTPIRQQRA